MLGSEPVRISEDLLPGMLELLLAWPYLLMGSNGRCSVFYWFSSRGSWKADRP